MYVMDADCLRNGSLFCRFAGKVNTKMKNESITGFCGKCATRFYDRTRILVQLNKGIG